ncbi:alpha/beta fold hydrolase [Halobaculum sp. MBLA0143]|uniref:alpha/beta fold hydrolase n=1 Tax=Halobaculum sp. MBLA0143 TaxID=3079933 RepID=UPI0035247FD7
MPHTTESGVRIYYETDGRGTVDGTETVVFLGDFGLGPWQWAWQAGALAGPFRTVVPTTRGAGRSDAPPGPYEIDDLVADVEAVLSAVGADSAHVVGAGLGGHVAIHAARRLGRVDRLVLLGTAASPSAYDPGALAADPNDPDAVRESLTAGLTEEFRTARSETVDRIVDWRTAEDAPPAVWEAQADAVTDATDWLYEVTDETLVVHGADDAVVPAAAGERLADDLPRGEFHAVPDAGHLVGVEAARPVNDRLHAFLGE